MDSRSYVDSLGVSWQVFQVERTVAREGSVTPGREHGWLAFASDQEKRRLSPVPPDWVNATDEQLEAMCKDATRVPAAAVEEFRRWQSERRVDQRRVSRREDMLPAAVRQELRDAAHAARGSSTPAIEAMMHIRKLLATRGIEPGSPEFRAARSLFLEVFYFEGTTP